MSYQTNILLDRCKVLCFNRDMILQLNPTIPVNTPKGEGYAFLVLDYSQEHDLLFTVMLDSGEVWTFSNKEIRGCKNITMDRKNPNEIK